VRSFAPRAAEEIEQLKNFPQLATSDWGGGGFLLLRSCAAVGRLDLSKSLFHSRRYIYKMQTVGRFAKLNRVRRKKRLALFSRAPPQMFAGEGRDL